jgi:alanine-glyoxylate transaminase/serine-glyoxylate transaminase/serine-pyruvate transaminase
LREILADGIEARVALHARAAAGVRAACAVLGLRPVPRSAAESGDTLSVLFYPAGADATLLPRLAARGVLVAGGLHPEIRTASFRIGHMGYTVTRPDYLRRTVEALADALGESGVPVDREGAVAALEATLTPPTGGRAGSTGPAG